MKKHLRSNFPWLSKTKVKYDIVDVIYWKQNTQFSKIKQNLVMTEQTILSMLSTSEC